MRTTRPTGDAASVFRDAKKLVEDARRSRQLSPQRVTPGLADEGFSPTRTGAFTQAALDGLAPGHFSAGIISCAWPMDSHNVPTRSTEFVDQADICAGDQPSRWQQLVHRVNKDSAASPAALSPAALSQLQAQITQDSSSGLQPWAAAPSTSTSLLSAAGGAPALFVDQHEKTARLSPQSHTGGARRPAGATLTTASSTAVGSSRTVSPYERAVAALQQAEQQLREQHRGKGAGTAAAGAGAPGPASPASATLAAAQRFLGPGGPGGAFAVPALAGFGGAGRAGGVGGAGALHDGQYAGRERPSIQSRTAAGVNVGEGSFEEVAMGMMQRLASAVTLGLPVAPPPTFSALEPPPAQHVAAAAALAAASAVAAKRAAAGAAALGEADAPAGTAASDATAAPVLELQIAMQGLMSAARQATSEEALRAERERRNREAAAAVEAEAEAVEERAMRLARVVLYLRLWQMAARWGRREAREQRTQLLTARLRRCVVAWRTVSRASRAERLAGEALELAEEARREQVAHQFRRLWLLHRALGMWRVAALESAKERQQEQLRAEDAAREQAAEAARQAAADRFRRLWLLHASFRTWRTAARAGAAARAAAGREQQRRTAVTTLLGRLRQQRQAFLGSGPGGIGADTCGAVAEEPDVGPLVDHVQQPMERPCAGAAAALTSPGQRTTPGSAVGRQEALHVQAPPTSSGRAFPGLNKWIRPTYVPQARSRPSVSNGAASIASSEGTNDGAASTGGGGSAQAGTRGDAKQVPRATTTRPFQLATGARARYRRERLLSECEATRHLAAGGSVFGADASAAGASAGPGECSAEDLLLMPEMPAAGVSGTGAGSCWGAKVSAAALPGEQGQLAATEASVSGNGSDVEGLGPDDLLQAVLEARSRAGERGDAGQLGRTSSLSEVDQQSDEEAWRDGEATAGWECVGGSGRASVSGSGAGSAARGRHSSGSSGAAGAGWAAGDGPTSLRRRSFSGPQHAEPLAQSGAGGASLKGFGDGCGDGLRHSGTPASVASASQRSSLAGGSFASASSASGMGARASAHAPQNPYPCRDDALGCSGESSFREVTADPQSEMGAWGAMSNQGGHSPAALKGSRHHHGPGPHVAEPGPGTGVPQPGALWGEASSASVRQPLQHLKAQQLRRQQMRPRSAPRVGCPQPGAWRPPSPPPQPQRPPSHQRQDADPPTSVFASATRQTAPVRGGGLRLGSVRAACPGSSDANATAPAFSAADLARLRALEVRKRKQADDAARQLAGELAAHMEALAAVHWRRALLTWFGMRPWLQLVGGARAALLQAERHWEAALARRALQALAMSVVRVRMRRVCRVAAAVAAGRACRRERLARAALGRLVAWARAAALHRRHMRHRVLLGLMRSASAAWSARADAEDYARRRRLWGCFTGWRQAAEREASQRLLWELQRQHEAEQALGRSLSRRVLAAWRLAAAEGAEQRAALQQRSAQWAKVQGWLREVQAARVSGASVSGTSCASSVAAAAAGVLGPPGAGGAIAPAASAPRGGDTVPGIEDIGLGDDFLRASAGRAGPADDPLGLGPLEDHLREFSLGPSGIAARGPGSSKSAGVIGVGGRASSANGDPGSRWAGPAVAYGTASACVGPIGGMPEGARVDRRTHLAGPPRPGPTTKAPALPSRQDRLARYLDGRGRPKAAGAGALED